MLYNESMFSVSLPYPERFTSSWLLKYFLDKLPSSSRASLNVVCLESFDKNTYLDYLLSVPESNFAGLDGIIRVAPVVKDSGHQLSADGSID